MTTRRLFLAAALLAVIVAGIATGRLPVAAARPAAGPAQHRNASQFPRSLYPKPASFPPWGLGEGCASLAGVQAPGPGAVGAAFQTMA